MPSTLSTKLNKLNDEYWPIKLPYGLDDLVLIGDHLFSIGVHWKSDVTFKQYILAAAKAYMCGNNSIDYTLKRYKKIWNLESQLEKEHKIIYETTDYIKFKIKESFNKYRLVPDKPDHSGLFAAGAALYRLWNTFDAAIYTNRNMLHFETGQMLKLVLEQLAWVYSVYNLDNGKHFKVTPSKCISNFKNVFPEAGKLYGTLNEIAHIAPEETHRYIYINNSGLVLDTTNKDFCSIDTFYMLILCDMYCCLTEIIYPKSRNLKYIKKDKDNNFSFKQNRETYKKIISYKKSLLKRFKS